MKAKEERKELEGMIEQAEKNISGNVPNQNEVPELEQESAFDIDYEKLTKKCDTKARKLIKDATGLMMTDEMVKQNPYVKNKMEVDKVSLSGMLYQMEVNRIMQQSLMEEVRTGASHPRMFEVFGQLSKTISELNKQLLQTVEAIKSTYKDIKYDINERDNETKALTEGEGNLKRSKEGLIAVGSKELIKNTKKLKFQKYKETNSNNDIQDVEPEE